MSSIKPIPVREIAMKNGINIGGFQYKTYQNGPQWDLHLHPVGGFVSLTLKESGATFFVSLAQVDCVEGYAGQPVSSSPSGFASESQGLVSNQHRVEIPAEPVKQVDRAMDLGEPSEKDKRAKDAHFGTKVSESVSTASEADLLSDLPPVKKKRGRPRKIRLEEPQALS